MSDADVDDSSIVTLSPDLIRDITGEDDLLKVKEIEVIFNDVHYLDALDSTPNLKSLTLVQTGLRQLSNLMPVGHSLLRLVITEQKIARMENLALPNLRDLMLHCNDIVRIEGLTGCPRLQRLWLYSNRIAKIENLDGVGDLRELWLQDNRLTRISGVEHLVNLQVLALGNNRISEFKDIQKLSHLPVLRSLSFNDVHFGSCPIVSIEGYRAFIMVSLPQLSELDGRPIDSGDRKAALDSFMVQTLEFGRRVDALCRDHERELLELEARRKANLKDAAAVRDDLLRAFSELETVVHAGRADLVAEQERQQRIRAANFRQLVSTLEQIKREHGEWISRRIAGETKALSVEKATFHALKARAAAEARDTAAFAKLSFDTQGAVVAQDLSEHAPDYRLLQSLFKSAHSARVVELSAKKSKSVTLVRLLKSFKVFERFLERKFVAVSDSSECLRLFVCGDPRQLQAALLDGLPLAPLPAETGPDDDLPSVSDLSTARSTESGTTASSKTKKQGRDGKQLRKKGEPEVDEDEGLPDPTLPPSPVMLFTDPWDAIAYELDLDPTVGATPSPGRVHALLMCRVCTGKTLGIPLLPPPPPVVNVHGEVVAARNSYRSRLDETVARAFESLPAEYPCACVLRETEEQRAAVAAELARLASPAGKYSKKFEAPKPPSVPEPVTATGVPLSELAPGGCYALRNTDRFRVLPEYYCLLAERGVGSTESSEAALEESLAQLARGQLSVNPAHVPTGFLLGGGTDPDSADILAQYQKQVSEAVAIYEENIWRELEPEQALALTQTEEEVKKLGSTLQVLRDEIESEKRAQEELLRDFRAQALAGVQFANTMSGAGGTLTRSMSTSGGLGDTTATRGPTAARTLAASFSANSGLRPHSAHHGPP